MDKNIQITCNESQDITEIIDFYKSVNEDVYIDTNEKVFLAKVKNQIIGSVRLVNEKDYYVLRTLNILPIFQRKGIGTRLVRSLLPYVKEKTRIYCLPYPNVKEFYQQFGFHQISHQELPEKLKHRYLEYKKEFDVIAMVK
jgi:N-acetylglutamate synthase-like GNAT family acetyltransferase